MAPKGTNGGPSFIESSNLEKKVVGLYIDTTNKKLITEFGGYDISLIKNPDQINYFSSIPSQANLWTLKVFGFRYGSIVLSESSI
jgi:hypothetical protein